MSQIVLYFLHSTSVLSFYIEVVLTFSVWITPTLVSCSTYRVDSMIAPSQWKTSLQSNAVSHWLGANLESALTYVAIFWDFQGPMGLLPDTLNCGLCMRRECRQRFPGHRLQKKPLVCAPTCITTRAWRTYCDACRDRQPKVAGYTIPAFPAHAQPAISRIGQEAHLERWSDVISHRFKFFRRDILLDFDNNCSFAVRFHFPLT